MNSAISGHWQVVTSKPEFLALRNEWEELFALNPGHRPFLAWGWVAAWLDHLAGEHRLHIICLRDADGALQYVLPLIFGTAGGRYGNPRYISVCGYGPDCSDQLGCLRRPVLESDMVELAAIAIARYCGKKSRIELTHLDGSGDFPQKLATMLAKEGRIVRMAQQAVCPAVKLSGTWDDYALQLSSNFRSQVRRHHKRIVNHDTVKFRSIGAAEARAFAVDLVRLNRTRMQDKGDVSSLEDAAFRDFLYDAVPYMADQALAWMDVVEDGGDTFGAALNFVHGNTVYYYMGGFAADAGHLRPGTALFVEVIKRSHESGFNRYDFLRGAESYKYRWGAMDTPTYHLTVYPGGPLRASIARMVDEFSDRGRKLIRRLRTAPKED